MEWQPHITVAAVIEKDGKYLVVEEYVDGHLVINQPAGHWEPGESLLEAAQRETLEETGWEFYPTQLIGIYRWVHPYKDETFLRFSFCGNSSTTQMHQDLDKGIHSAKWLSAEEILALPEEKIRSTMVTESLNDYLNGNRYSLELIKDIHQHW